MPTPEGLLHSPAYLIPAAALLGLCVGSFLNVVAFRLPAMLERDWRRECRALLELPAAADTPPLSLHYPPSTCPSCGSGIRPWHNVPVLSWLWLRGRCAYCASRISAQYPIVEAATALLSGLCAWHFGWTPALAAALALTWTLIALAAIDWNTQLLPDQLTLPLLWLGLLLSLAGVFTGPQASILGAAAGYLSLWGVYHAFRLATGKEGMGYGDFKLLAALGAWLGWQALPAIILVASFTGAIVGGLMLLRGHDRAVPIPFGPYLAAAGWLCLISGDSLSNAWLRWIYSGA